jgi:acyl carrier protein
MSANVLDDRVRRIVASSFNVPLGEVNTESSDDSLAQWDSLGQLVLILELEREFGLELSPEQGERLRSIVAITDMLSLRGL